jgi:hypothetical protein
VALSFDGLFGSVFDQKVYLRDSRHAAESFGLNKAYLGNGTPRFKFQFFTRINFSTEPEITAFVRNFLNTTDQDIVSVMVKDVTMPSMNIETETLNQYNKKRISQTKIEFQPITMTLHDSVEGRSLRLWEMYYEYYFRDGVAPEKLKSSTQKVNKAFKDDVLKHKWNPRFGYNIGRVGNNKYLIDSIEIFQVNGGQFSRTEIIHPRITAFTHDTLDYEATNGLVELKFTFAYEDVLYANVNEPLSQEELERYRYGDFWEMANLITIRNPVRGRNINTQAPYPEVGCDAGAGGGLLGNILPSKVGSTLGKIIGEKNVQRVEDSITGIVQSIPNAIGQIASASIFGGEISLQPDPVNALKTTANQVGRSVINNTRDKFTSAVAGAATNAAKSIVTGITPLKEVKITTPRLPEPPGG